MSEYILQINVEPEIISSKPLYFWCIIKNNNLDTASNYGFGWATSVDSAFEEAYSHYKKFIFKKL